MLKVIVLNLFACFFELRFILDQDGVVFPLPEFSRRFGTGGCFFGGEWFCRCLFLFLFLFTMEGIGGVSLQVVDYSANLFFFGSQQQVNMILQYIQCQYPIFPVSYTHLDVYKRQQYKRSIRTCKKRNIRKAITECRI